MLNAYRNKTDIIFGFVSEQEIAYDIATRRSNGGSSRNGSSGRLEDGRADAHRAAIPAGCKNALDRGFPINL